MGEVYKARDTRLDRTVAIKILPHALAADPHFRDRFEREARTISQLDHPHICALYDVGEQNSTAYLVMQYLEGETLAKRLARGSLPVPETLAYAIQIADALNNAHRCGIVHRDLKPANIMLTKVGAKLLDFGLAKLREPASVRPAGGAAEQPTAARSLTAVRTILGTLPYMAPEQLEGSNVDARADVFAFGAVVYEMATGRKAFEGKGEVSLIAAILDREPPSMSSLQPLTPPLLDHVITRCLAKHPDNRWQSAGDVMRELQWIAAGGLIAPGGSIQKKRSATIAVGAAGLAIVAGALTLSLKPSTDAPHAITRFSIVLPADQGFTRSGRQSVAISPDGTKIVYVANQRMYLRSTDQIEPTPIPGTNIDPANPFFSTDGRWIGFWASNELRKIGIDGGTPLKLCDVAAIPFGASWTGDRVLVGQGSNGIVEVSANGGSPRVIVKVDSARGELAHGPQLLPGQQAVLFTLAHGQDWENARAVVESLRTGERKVILESARDARYVETGYIIYGHAQTILAVPFDARRIEITGSPVPLVENVMASNPTGSLMFALSRSGTLAFIPGDSGPNRTLVWKDRQGVETTIAAGTRPFDEPRLSPDGTQVAVHIADREDTIWIWNFSRGSWRRLRPGRSDSPRWTPDGLRIVYNAATDGARGIFSATVDGIGDAEPIVAGNAYPRSISPDGRWLVAEEFTPASGFDLKLIALHGDRPNGPALNSPFLERWGEVSPDGRWLAYQSNESGRPEIHVRAFPDLDSGHWIASTGGAGGLQWSRMGHELFFVELSGEGIYLVAVPVRADGRTFVAAKPVPLFSMNGYSGRYDVTADGRFLMVKDDVENQQRRVVVIENWDQELKTRVPSK